MDFIEIGSMIFCWGKISRSDKISRVLSLDTISISYFEYISDIIDNVFTQGFSRIVCGLIKRDISYLAAIMINTD